MGFFSNIVKSVQRAASNVQSYFYKVGYNLPTPQISPNYAPPNNPISRAAFHSGQKLAVAVSSNLRRNPPAYVNSSRGSSSEIGRAHV